MQEYCNVLPREHNKKIMKRNNVNK